jgi:ABC-type amino acid transport substrate-binding protein
MIRVGIDPTTPPFSYVNPSSGNVEGFTVEFMTEIGLHIDQDIQFVTLAYRDFLPELLAGKIDVVMVSQQIDAKSQDRLLTSEPVFYSETQLVVRRHDSTALDRREDFKGKKVGVQSGWTASTAHDFVRQRYDNIGLAIADLRHGELDAVCVERPVAHALVHGDSAFSLTDVALDRASQMLVVRHADSTLLNSLTEAYCVMTVLNTVAELIENWDMVGAMDYAVCVH